MGYIAHQVPLTTGFLRQEYWSGLPCPPPGGLPNPGMELRSPKSPAWADGFFTTGISRRAQILVPSSLAGSVGVGGKDGSDMIQIWVGKSDSTQTFTDRLTMRPQETQENLYIQTVWFHYLSQARGESRHRCHPATSLTTRNKPTYPEACSTTRSGIPGGVPACCDNSISGSRIKISSWEISITKCKCS